MTKRNEAGFMGVFVSKEDAQCASCEIHRQNDVVVEDVVPLTLILYDYLDDAKDSQTLIRDADLHTIPDLTPKSVVPFLEEHLQWRMIDLKSGLLAGQEQRAELEVTVTSRQYLGPTEEHLMGVYGAFTAHERATNTKPGGLGYRYSA